MQQRAGARDVLGHGQAGGIGVAGETRGDYLGVLVFGMLVVALAERNRVKELIVAAPHRGYRRGEGRGADGLGDSQVQL